MNLIQKSGMFFWAMFGLVLASENGLSVFAQTSDVRPLTIEQPVERELKGDEAHSYSLALTAGQFLDVVVEQKGIDVVVTLFDPNGKKVAEVDSPNGMHDPEQLSLIIESTGKYILEIHPLEKIAPAGRYQAKIVELQTASKKDEIIILARKAYAEGENLLQLQQTRGSWLNAIKKFEESSSLYKSIADDGGEAKVNTKIGYFYSVLNDRQKTLDYYNRALLLYRKADDTNGQAHMITKIGAVYSSLGENQKALEYYLEVLPLLRIISIPYYEAATLNSIGKIYFSLGKNRKALEYYNQALPLFGMVNDKIYEARVLLITGIKYYALREYQRALEYYSKALLLYRQVGDKRRESSMVTHFGSVYASIGKKQISHKYFNQFRLMLPIDFQSSEIATLNGIGAIYASLGEKQKVLEYYLQALLLRHLGSDIDFELYTLNNLFVLWNSLNNPRFTTFFGKITVNNHQQSRSITMFDTTHQRWVLKRAEFAYRNLTDILIKQERYDESQQVLNTFKDEQIFDLYKDERIFDLYKDERIFDSRQKRIFKSLTLTPREAEMFARFNRITSHIGTIGSKISELKHTTGKRPSNDEDNKQLQELESQLKSATDEFNSFIKQAETEFAAPPDEKDQSPEINDLKEMQTALRELSQSTGQKTAAVYTLVGKDEYKALLITADSIDAVSYPINDAELNQKALQLWKLLQSPDYDPQPIAAELYKIVFAPFAAKLPNGTKTILWSLDGNLRYVPVSALHDGKGYLVERFNNVIFTRADKERLTRAVSHNWTGTGLGSSKARSVKIDGTEEPFEALFGVKTELFRIFKKDNPNGVFAGDVLLDENFTKSAMISALKARRPLVHIASHFKFEPGDEARSFLLLGDGQPFTLDEMKSEKDLFGGVELLTLSACQTAAQRPDASGLEVDSFAELAQRLGAGAILASLWELSDDSTAELMTRFYQNRAAGGMNKAAALRNAQLSLLKGEYKTIAKNSSKKTRRGLSELANIKIEPAKVRRFKPPATAPFAHPFYWSPFVLFGNWK